MKKLLIVVDYQNDFVDGTLGFAGAECIDEYIAGLVETYHESNDDIIFTFDTHQENYLNTQEGRHLPITHCIEGTQGWKLYGKVSQTLKESDYTINKPGFGSLELGKYLEGKEYESITFVGLVSNICVISNAIIAKAALPEVEIIIDCMGIGSNDLNMQDKALDVLENLQFTLVNRMSN